MKLLFLGTGGSLGVPVVGCSCEVCHSFSPHDKRLRPSALVTLNNKNILIDAGPDFRTQALRANIKEIDAVFLTHLHFDHIGGFDDLRSFFFKKNIHCYLSHQTFEDLKVRYHYLFRPEEFPLHFHVLEEESGHFSFEGVKVEYMTYNQNRVKVLGFRIGTFAYIMDIRDYSDEIFEKLKGVETMVLSALRHEPTKAHFSLDEAIRFAEKVGAKKTWLSHIAHELQHEKTNQILPKHVQLAHDGLEI